MVDKEAQLFHRCVTSGSLDRVTSAAGRSQGDRREDLARAFTEQRPRLVSLAYRLSGSVADAEDAVQEAWIRLQRADADPATAPVDVPAWLTTTTTRIALDQLRSAGRRKETYVGPWLPEPRLGQGVGAAPAPRPDDAAALADELSFAVMVVLEALTPPQRAAFILHDTFGVPFEEIAQVLGRTPAAVRQLASRAREQVASGVRRERPDGATHRRTLEAFLAASAGGDLQSLVQVLDPSVVYRADGGGLVRTALNVVSGPERVARLVLGVLRRTASDVGMSVRTVNGAPGLVFARGETLVGVVALDVTAEGRVAAIDVLMNPEKLARLTVGA
jgi:RNA polymerase sigma-70 factor, ECF subfamily